MPADQDAKGSDPIAEHKRRARWRLLGALILVAAVAAIAPVLLEDQARPLSQDLLIEISPRASAPAPASVAVTPPAQELPPKKVEVASEPLKSPDPAKAEPTKVEPVKQELAKVEPTKTEAMKPAPVKEEAKKAEPTKLPAAKTEAAKPAEPAKKAQAFMVQVGAYGSLEAANRVKSRLEGAGHRVTVQTIKTTDGAERHRVRIGPFQTRDQAIEVRDRAKSQGYDAAVVAAS